jgi:hypothetical protein
MTHWSATIEYAGAITDEQARMLASGSGFAVAVHGDRTTVTLRVEADTLRRATKAAIRQARDRVGGVIAAAPVSLHVLSHDTPAAGVEHPAVPELVDAAQAREILGGISQQRLYQLQQTGDLPEPVQRFGGGRGVWVKAAIAEYAKRERRPGRPRKTPEN